jgi:glucose-1-phosphate thymidylyltransferase/glucose-1-phosphate adenylyltransferase
LGTADAVLQGMLTRPDWKRGKFTVCNSDNLYSVEVLKRLLQDTHLCAMADYDRDALGVELDRVKAFAIIWKDGEGYLTDIVEKPGPEEIEKARDANGRVGVSMNIFRLDYDALLPVLETCPLHPVRQEKELPTALKMLLEENPKAIFTIQVSEPVPDLTSKGDLLKVRSFLEKFDF